MSFTNKYFIYLLPFVLHYNISCTSPRISVLALSYTPDFSKKLFLSNLKNLENKANKNPFDASLLFNASKELTIFSYGYTMEEAARLKISDYSASKTIYLKAHNDFVRSIDYINSSLDLEYPGYKTWIVEKNQKKLDFNKVSVEKLYWAAGAYAGAIQSSNGDPKWIIQLPKIGQLLESGMKIDPEWNYGSFYTAMISYTLIRHDAKNNKFVCNLKDGETNVLKMTLEHDEEKTDKNKTFLEKAVYCKEEYEKRAAKTRRTPRGANNIN